MDALADVWELRLEDVVSGLPMPTAGPTVEVVSLVGVMVVLAVGIVVAVLVFVPRRSSILSADRRHALSTEISPIETTISIPVFGSRQLIARARGFESGVDV